MDMFTLWDHQKRAIEFAKQKEGIAIFHDTGTGKTLTTIEIIKDRCEERGHFLNVAIICPKGILYNWKKNITNFMSVEDGTCVVLDGSVKSRIDRVKEAKGFGRIFIINFEGMQKKEMTDALIKHKIHILVVDESHRLKNHAAVRTRQVQRLADSCNNKYILTGTPVLQDERDLFSQLRILDGGQVFGRSFEAFKILYMEDKNSNRKGTHNYWPDWRIRPSVRDKIADMVSRVSTVAKKEDCMDLPNRITINHVVGVSDEQKIMYNKMQKDWVAEILNQDGDVDRIALAQMALHRGLRLQQILTGFVNDSDGKLYVIKDNPRIEALKDIVSDISPKDKIVVWAAFKQNYVDIEEMLASQKVSFATLYGDTKDKQYELDRFVNDPTVRVMVANPRAGGTGIDGLQVAPVCVYYSKDYSLEGYLQSRDRTYRGGSEVHEKCLEIHLQAPDTIDEEVDKALKSKKEIGDALLNWQPTLLELTK